MTTAAPRSLAQWLEYQQRVHARAIDMELGRVRTVAQRLGLLAPACPVVTVAGTNGKGSTAATLAALLQAHGLDTGLFTSPHLCRYNERIAVGGRLATDEELVAAFEHIDAARAGTTLTFFEYNTLAALWLFRAQAVAAMVLEVGLGGRLDATNIIDAQVAVLCSVGLDHRDWLGDTLEAIGAEKAGIFRPQRPVVLGSRQMPGSVLRIAGELGCPVWSPGETYTWQAAAQAQAQAQAQAAGGWSFRGPGIELTALPAPRLAGRVQYDNAATALAAFIALRGAAACDPGAVARALPAVQLPGRLQILPGPVEWILDVAHNEPAAAVLAAALRERAATGRTVAVMGVLADKDAGAIARQLDPLIDEWVLCSLDEEPRGVSADELARRLGPVRGPWHAAAGVAAGCELARTLARPGDRVVACGSFHVVGPALRWLGLY